MAIRAATFLDVNQELVAEHLDGRDHRHRYRRPEEADGGHRIGPGQTRSDVVGRSYAPLGKTPVVRATGQRFGCSMISAITNRGALAFMVFQGKFEAKGFVEFIKRLLKQASGRLYLIVDGHPVHRSSLAKRFVAANATRLRLIILPGYCPELNPDELLNQDVKTNALGKSRPTNRAEMVATVRGHLHRRQKQPALIQNLFQEKHVRYAAP